MSADFSDLLGQLDPEPLPEAWIWQDEGPGATLTGYFEDLRHRTTSKGGPFPVAVIRRPDGTRVALWMFHTVLQEQFETASPNPGDRVAVRFMGKPEGRSYYEWRVAAGPDPMEG